MKRIPVLFMVLLSILMIFSVANAQLPSKYPPIDKSSNYTTYPVVPARSLTAAIDTFISTYYIPGSVSNVIFWLQVDTLTAGGTLKTNIQGSPDGTNWISIANFADMTAAGSDRQVVTLVDKYLRVTDTVSGSPDHVYRKVYATPKSNYYWDARVLTDICIYDSSGAAVLKPSEQFLVTLVKGLTDSLSACWHRKDTSMTTGVKAVVTPSKLRDTLATVWHIKDTSATTGVKAVITPTILRDTLATYWCKKDTNETPGLKYLYTPTMAAAKADKAGSTITGSFWYSDSMHAIIIKDSDRKSWKIHVRTDGSLNAQHDTTSN
jgi:hypothetical protein